jgi:hypothetical protein
MNEQANNHLYGAETILRYLNGQMNREETRIFELALLDDDLLADAVTGYRMMQTSMTDRAILDKAEELKSPVSKGKEEKKPAVVKMPALRWLGYAVAATFVVAAGWWLFNISRPNNVLPEDAAGNTQMVEPLEDKAMESTTGDVSVSAGENPLKPVTEQTEPILKKGDAPKIATVPANAKAKDAAKALPEVSPETRQQPLTHDIAIAEKMNPDKDTKARLMVPSSVQSAKQYRFTWTFEDSARVSPKSGWNAYRKFLAEQFTPVSPLETTAKAILTIEVSGMISAIAFEGTFTDEEKTKLEKAIKTGPEWKNHTRTKQQTTIQWQ